MKIRILYLIAIPALLFLISWKLIPLVVWQNTSQAKSQVDKIIQDHEIGDTTDEILEDYSYWICTDPTSTYSKSGIWYDFSPNYYNTIQQIDLSNTGVQRIVIKSQEGKDIVNAIQMPIKELEKASQNNDHYCSLILGLRYKFGFKLPIDIEASDKFLKKSADLKNPFALRSLAIDYMVPHFGSGRNFSRQTDYGASEFFYILNLEEAARRGDAYSMYLLALEHSYSDDEKWASWITACLKEDDLKSNLLAHSALIDYYREVDIKIINKYNINPEKSARFILDLAQKGLMPAQEKIGRFFWEEKVPDALVMESFKKDAIFWNKKAALNGSESSQRFLAECYSKGNGIPVNSAEAAVWWEMAASQNPNHAYGIGMAYLDGVLLQKNEEKAIKWLLVSAIQAKSEYAQYQIGQCYWKGIHFRRNLVCAYAWINLANTRKIYSVSLDLLRSNLSETSIEAGQNLSGILFDHINP
jgi:TPR repeat protein